MRSQDESGEQRQVRPLKPPAAEGMAMADKRCQNGHVIDEVWDICPYCPSGARPSAAPVPSPSRPIGRPEPQLFRDEAPSGWEGPPPNQTVIGSRGGIAPEPVSEPRWLVGWLVSISGRMIGEALPIRGGRNIIGRSPKSDIVIPDEQVSSHHADIIYRSDERRFIVMDHHSTNGTFVNESEVTSRLDLADRDVIRLGRQKFLFIALCDRRFGWDQVEQKR